MSISRGLLGEPKVKGLGLGLAAAFALGDAACWVGIWRTCLEGREIRGLGFRHADAASFVIFVFSNVGLRCPSFEGFWEGQKVRGLGLGWLPPSVGMGGCCMLHLEGLVSLSKSAKGPQPCKACYSGGFTQGRGPPRQKPAWGWLPPSPLNAASWLGIWILARCTPTAHNPGPSQAGSEAGHPRQAGPNRAGRAFQAGQACFSGKGGGLAGRGHSFPVILCECKTKRFGLGAGCRLRPCMLRPGWGPGFLAKACFSGGGVSRQRAGSGSGSASSRRLIEEN